MKKPQYLVTFKAFCEDCQTMKNLGKWHPDKKGSDGKGLKYCPNCHWGRYHCRNLKSFVDFLNTKYPNWVFFNVFDKKSKEKLKSFVKGKNEPTDKYL